MAISLMVLLLAGGVASAAGRKAKPKKSKPPAAKAVTARRTPAPASKPGPKPARAVASEKVEVRVASPCTENENWQFGGDLAARLGEDFREEFSLFIARKAPPYRGFAVASAFQKTVGKDTGQAFARYWLGRALFEAELHDLAAEHFNALVTETPTPARLPIQVAAMACLERMHRRNPVFGFNDLALANLPAFFKPGLAPSRYLPVLWEAAAIRTLKLIRTGAPAVNVESSLALLNGAGHHEDFVRAIWAVRNDKPTEAVPRLTRLIAAGNLPAPLKTRRNEMRLLLARLYYQLHKYQDAIKHLELIDKNSNELVEALTTLSNAQLMAGDYSKAIGASFSLQSGGLKRTFGPEGLMVSAMALNELCQYPDSLRTLSTFKRSYYASFQWLRQHANDAPGRFKLYPLAMAYLKNKKFERPETPRVPERIGSEWIRSSIFVSRQEAINGVFQRERAIPGMIAEATTLRETDAREMAEQHKSLLDKIRETRKQLKPGAPFPPDLKREVARFKLASARQKYLAQAIPEWKQLLETYRAGIKHQLEAHIAAIETELRLQNQRMLRHLAYVIENNELIEAEIWNGASQDMVWQNAHPEYKELVKKGKLQNDRAPSSHAGAVYDWGTSGNTLDGSEEVWEDELGSIQANLQNNCANKEKYMKLQREKK